MLLQFAVVVERGLGGIVIRSPYMTYGPLTPPNLFPKRERRGGGRARERERETKRIKTIFKINIVRLVINV